MAVLPLLLTLFCVAAWAAGLGRAWKGQPRLSLLAAGGSIAIGLLTIVLTFALPRDAFGELGHGDGMGLIGLMTFGALGVGVGFVAFAIAVVIFVVGRQRRNQPVKE